MTFNEEQKLSLQAGEFIHTISNFLSEGRIKIDGVDDHRIKIIVDISHVLRCETVRDDDAPLLLTEGFKLSDYPRSAWIDLADRLICNPYNSIPEIIELTKGDSLELSKQQAEWCNKSV